MIDVDASLAEKDLSNKKRDKIKMAFGIRGKILIYFGFVILLLILTLYIIMSTIIFSGFETIESFYGQKNVMRVVEAIDADSASLGRTCEDYAYWDDTYYFAIGEQPEYPIVGAPDEVLPRLRLTYLIITDKNGDFLMFKHYDGESVVSTPTVDDIQNIKREARLFVHRYSNETVNGILTLSSGPAIFAASNVLDTDLAEESAGSLIMIRSIDGLYMDEISAITKLKTSIILYDDFDVESWSNPIMLDNVVTGKSIVSPELDQNTEKYPFKIIDDYYSMSYTIVDDITGVHSFVVTILSEREIYSQAKMVAGIYFIASLIVCLFLYLLLFLLLNNTLLSRISNINRDIKTVYEKKDLRERIIVEGEDELSELTDSFNKILAGLESADYERNVIFDANPDTLLMADSEGKLVAKKISKSLLLKFTSPEYNKTKGSVSSEIKVNDVFSEKNMIIMRTSALESIKDNVPKIIELAEGFGESTSYFEVRIYPYKKDALIMVRDISERKKYEEMLKLKNEEFQRFNSMAVDRELKMIELKKEIERLRVKTGEINSEANKIGEVKK